MGIISKQTFQNWALCVKHHWGIVSEMLAFLRINLDSLIFYSHEVWLGIPCHDVCLWLMSVITAVLPALTSAKKVDELLFNPCCLLLWRDHSGANLEQNSSFVPNNLQGYFRLTVTHSFINQLTSWLCKCMSLYILDISGSFAGSGLMWLTVCFETWDYILWQSGSVVPLA